ncbi:MAG: GH92 family glycosyl hydrolase, partial [Deltaproteobacteria bacterium]|nr:GH92 family glycosyl hydrolase [Deltaproteobacteria bacterium]
MIMHMFRFMIITYLFISFSTACTSPGNGTPVPDLGAGPEVVAELPGDIPADPGADRGAAPDDVQDEDAGPRAPEPLTGHVNPFIGTGGTVQGIISYRIGNAFVGASVPFGLLKLGPDTKHALWGEPVFTHCEGYWYEDTHVGGFSHMHLHGTGAVDYATLGVMPSIGMHQGKVTEAGRMLPLDHGAEHAEPGYYSLELGSPPILAELTATRWVGVHRYTFHDTDQAVVLIDPAHEIADCEIPAVQIEIDRGAGTAEGWLDSGCGFAGRFGGYRMYFHARFDTLPVEAGVWEGENLFDTGPDVAAGEEAGAWFRFDVDRDHPVELAVGISLVGTDNARAHLEKEVGDRGFDLVRAEAHEAWEEALGRARAVFPDDAPQDVVTQYYTSLYHAMLMPSTWSEHDGRYMGFDDQVHVAEGFAFYTDFSLWDTYRTLHPLLFLLFPEESRDMVRSLLEMARLHGCLPQWVLANGDSGSMIGDPSSIVVADAWLHGLEVPDEEELFEQLLRSAGLQAGEDPLPDHCADRDGKQDYIQYGYHPFDLHGESVSKTQEIAWADYCVSQVADALGRTSERDQFLGRALSPFNLWNPTVGFFDAKDSAGQWKPGFDPFIWKDQYTEGNAWQYLWLVPHDPGGIAAAMGGAGVYLDRLDELFEATAAHDDPLTPPKHYFHGNEPDLHYSFMYSLMGRPGDAARWSRWLMDAEYQVAPTGLAGNDDAGTLAAWYVFAALGFYPFPCTGRYALGAPRVAEATLAGLGGPIRILVPDASEARPYVESATWNGEPLETPWIPMELLREGGELVVT